MDFAVGTDGRGWDLSEVEVAEPVEDGVGAAVGDDDFHTGFVDCYETCCVGGTLAVEC